MKMKAMAHSSVDRFIIAKLILMLLLLLSVPMLVEFEAQTMHLDISVISGGMPSGSVLNTDVRTGFVNFDDETELQVMSDVNWRVTASVVIDGSPAGTGNPTANSIEIGNNDNPGEYNAGTGLVQTGTPGTFNIFVDFRLNLGTLVDAPAGNFDYTITYTLEEL